MTHMAAPTLVPVKCAARRVRKSIPFEHGLRLQIQAMLEEREGLLEEVRQLRAAVHIYSAVAEKLQGGSFPLRAA